jgi:hypothetical protein
VQLVQLQEFAGDLAAQGWGLAAITIDTPEVLARFARERQLSYSLYSGKNLIADARLVDPGFDADPARAGAPHPVIYLLDPKGRITARFYESERMTLRSALARTGVVTSQEGQLSPGKVADIRIWLPDAEVRAGQTVSIAFDIKPKPGMHVYAPGQHSYTPLSVQLAPNDLVQPRTTDLPPSVPYTYVPLNETVPVYKDPVTAFKNLQMKSALSGSTVKVSGQLEFQACDDIMCYPVQRIPFSVQWPIARAK